MFRYTFEGVCKECPELKLEDGATKIFINTRGKNRQDFSQEFLDFMDYINATTDHNAACAKSSKIKLIHETVRKVRMSEKMGVKYMQLWEEKEYIREDAREKGLAEGRAEGRAEGIRVFIVDNLEEGKSKDVIIGKLMKHFGLLKEEAEEYFEKNCSW